MGRISLDRQTLVECFPYMEEYYKLPRKMKKAMKIKLTRDVKKAILYFIDDHLEKNDKLDLTKK